MSREYRLLVVDDVPAMRHILERLLNEAGFRQIVQAGDGRVALSMLLAGGFDLLITDWNLPGLAGIDLLKAVRADARLARLPVLMVTSQVNRAQIVEATRAGVSGYIVKPFTARLLSERVKQLLSAHTDDLEITS